MNDFQANLFLGSHYELFERFTWFTANYENNDNEYHCDYNHNYVVFEFSRYFECLTYPDLTWKNYLRRSLSPCTCTPHFQQESSLPHFINNTSSNNNSKSNLINNNNNSTFISNNLWRDSRPEWKEEQGSPRKDRQKPGWPRNRLSLTSLAGISWWPSEQRSCWRWKGWIRGNKRTCRLWRLKWDAWGGGHRRLDVSSCPWSPSGPDVVRKVGSSFCDH